MQRIFFFTVILTTTFIFINKVVAETKMKVVTTFTVIADIASNIAGDAAEVVSITKPGAEIHGYEPTPQDIVRASNADLILRNGMNLELWFEKFLKNIGNVPSVILTKGINPISIKNGMYKGNPNPHAWMSINNADVYIDNIEAAFSINDPSNAYIYKRNSKLYKKKLHEAIDPIRDLIINMSINRRWLVTCEGAFSYLARDFYMKELYLWPINADQIGTPQQVRYVIDQINENNIPVIFCESTVNSAPAKQIARETKAIYGGVLYVDSLSAKNGPVHTYLDLLFITSSTILEGLINTQ